MTGLPDDVRRFLNRHVDSVEQLEVLLLIRRAPGRSWSAADLARELYIRPQSVAQQFERLIGQGFVRERAPGFFQYAPRSAELDQVVARLADMHHERRLAVISLIASKPMESLKAFSDAFRIRKRDED